MSDWELKGEMRRRFLGLMGELSLERREAARLEVVEKLAVAVRGYVRVMSFVPFGDEVDIGAFNELLLGEGRCYFPRAEDGLLGCYEGSHKHLVRSRWGMMEPDAKVCAQIDPARLDCVIVPGLAFDGAGGRLGRGQGHYDRFLPLAPHAVFIGVGYQEQLSKEPLPLDPHDIKLHKLILG